MFYINSQAKNKDSMSGCVLWDRVPTYLGVLVTWKASLAHELLLKSSVSVPDR